MRLETPSWWYRKKGGLASALQPLAALYGRIAASRLAKGEPYRTQTEIAAEMIGYANKAHKRGEGGSGPVKRGLGVSIHTWGGGGHASNSRVTINPDASVSIDCGTQDLGTGTRTTPRPRMGSVTSTHSRSQVVPR